MNKILSRREDTITNIIIFILLALILRQGKRRFLLKIITTRISLKEIEEYECLPY